MSPPFIDSHFHMDATLSLGNPRLNQSGTLLEGISLWGELKPDLTVKAIKERALKYCDLAVARGLLGIRSHVDICDPRLLAVDALLEVKKEVSSYIDLQLVAFPQDGYFRSPDASKLLEIALDRGVDVVGGIVLTGYDLVDGFENWTKDTFGEKAHSTLKSIQPAILGAINALIAAGSAILAFRAFAIEI